MQASLKGATFILSQNRLQELLDEGRLSREAFEVQVSKETIELFDDKIEPTLWYPIQPIHEISRLLVDVDGDGDPGYLRSRGKETCARFLEGGVFKAFIDGALTHKGNEGPALVKITELCLSFGKWRFEGESLLDGRVVADDVEVLPDLLCESMMGFIEALASHATGVPMSVERERPRPGQVIFRITGA